MQKKNVFSCATNFLKDRKCIFCGSFKLSKTRRGYIKCGACFRQKSLKQLRREITIVKGFYQQQPAYRLANDLMVDYQSVTRVYQKLRIAIYHITELEGTKISGEIEMNEAYFGGRRKGKRVRGAGGKEKVQSIIQTLLKVTILYKRLGKHLRINHSKYMVDKRTKNHINGIEGFWSYAKHILCNYRGVSKYHFPMYLKEVECRFNHRNENLFKLFLSTYFGYVSH